MNEIEKLKEDIQTIYEITKSFEDTLLFILTLKDVKHTSVIQNIIITKKNLKRLEKIASRYHKYVFYDYDMEKYVFAPENEIGELYLSSKKITSSLFSDDIKFGKLLGYPIQYDLRRLINYRKKNNVSNFVYHIRSPPEEFTNRPYELQLLNYMVKECDENKVLDKTKEWIQKMNDVIQTIYPKTYIELEIEKNIGYPDDLTEEQKIYFDQFDEDNILLYEGSLELPRRTVDLCCGCKIC